MTRRTARGLAATLVVIGALVLASLPVAAADRDPEAILERARNASSLTRIAGVVEVRWLDSGKYFVERTGARADGGSFVVGRDDHMAVGDDRARWSSSGGQAIEWAVDPHMEVPRPGTVWHLDLADATEVASRPTVVVRARDDDGRVRARFYVDRETDVLLRRDVLSVDGAIIRSVRFTQVRLDTGAPAVPSLPEHEPVPRAVAEVPGQFPAPEKLDPGFELVGRYVHAGGAVQLFYGDGLFSLSVFEQPGVVEWSKVPTGAQRGEVDGNRADTYATATGTVAIWGADGLVLTVVSDAPPDRVAEALAGIAPKHSALRRAADFVLGPFGWD